MKNKVFSLGAREFTVEVIDDWDSHCLGNTDAAAGKITIYKKVDEHQEVPEDNLEETLWHEVLHAILISLGRHDLSNDEVFVSSCSALLTQAISTMEDSKRQKMAKKRSKNV
jgi:hypothetical protein